VPVHQSRSSSEDHHSLLTSLWTISSKIIVNETQAAEHFNNVRDGVQQTFPLLVVPLFL